MNMKTQIIALIVLFSTMGLANASPATLDLNPLSQDIEVGTTGTYNLTLNTTSSGYLSWETENPFLNASIDSALPGQTGNISVGTGLSPHTLYVTPLSGITIGTQYDITIWHTQGAGKVAKATATAGVIPIPELSTIALTSAGILGLIGLTRIQRKD
jgi:hypothetical protein